MFRLCCAEGQGFLSFNAWVKEFSNKKVCLYKSLKKMQKTACEIFHDAAISHALRAKSVF